VFVCACMYVLVFELCETVMKYLCVRVYVCMCACVRVCICVMSSTQRNSHAQAVCVQV